MGLPFARTRCSTSCCASEMAATGSTRSPCRRRPVAASTLSTTTESNTRPTCRPCSSQARNLGLELSTAGVTPSATVPSSFRFCSILLESMRASISTSPPSWSRMRCTACGSLVRDISHADATPLATTTASNSKAIARTRGPGSQVRRSAPSGTTMSGTTFTSASPTRRAHRPASNPRRSAYECIQPIPHRLPNDYRQGRHARALGTTL